MSPPVHRPAIWNNIPYNFIVQYSSAFQEIFLLKAHLTLYLGPLRSFDSKVLLKFSTILVNQRASKDLFISVTDMF